MEIVKMTADLVSQVARLEELFFSAPWSENAISGELTNPLSHWLVAVDGNKVCGYVGSQAVLAFGGAVNCRIKNGRELSTDIRSPSL